MTRTMRRRSSGLSAFFAKKTREGLTGAPRLEEETDA